MKINCYNCNEKCAFLREHARLPVLYYSETPLVEYIHGLFTTYSAFLSL